MNLVINPAAFKVSQPGACALVIMAKAPRVGSVKTRLTPLLSNEQAAELSRCFICDMAENIAALTKDASVCGIIAYMPKGQEAAFEGLLPHCFRLLPQRGADLGERLLNSAADLFGAGFAHVCLINSDSPTLPRSLLTEAMMALRQPGQRAVLGEATDGGYYLIGLQGPQPHLFQGIEWSTPRVAGQTLARAAERGLDVTRLARWYDVDDGLSLHELFEELHGTGPWAANRHRGYGAPVTALFLQRLAGTNPAVHHLLAEVPPEAGVQ
jgi:rSAM/selenodomain-associated transferase 1